ncbi:MAG TPA: TetR/AcrR family transcriptional regulator [Solirubrobacterales bacterium]|jgi:AcrR family transcriptional regulator|nr:TetR/AcrR family transcriptional regulator [Solirubrobacterales bacterium]
MNKPIAIEPDFADALSGERPTQRRPRMTREAIIDAAETLFIDRGYHGTRVSEVAELADVSIGSIYVHFVNKEGLYAALMERALAIEAMYFDAIFEDPQIPDLEKIIALGEAYLQFFQDYPAFFRMLMIPHEDVPEETVTTPIGIQVVARGKRQQEQLSDVIERCIHQGMLRDDIDPANAANFWWAAWNGVIALSLRRDKLQVSHDELKAVILEGRRMIAQGMAAGLLREPDGSIIPEFRERINVLKDGPIAKG